MLPSARRTLVTGASRGPGLEAVKLCLDRGDRVIAASRNPARVPILADWRAKYGTLELIALDPADAVSVAEAVPMLESLTSSIDLLIVGPGEPGVHEQHVEARDRELASISAIDLVEHYRRRAVAPLLLVRTLLPMLTEGEDVRVLFLQDGSAERAAEAREGYAARGTSAALVSFVPVLAAELAAVGISVATGTTADA